MTKAIQKKEADVTAIAKQIDQTPEYVQLVKDAYAKGASDLELQLFLATAKRVGLNPMARQIYCIERWSNGQKVMTTQVSIDGFRLIADRTGKYVPGREPTFTFNKAGDLESATAYIKKLVAGEWHEISATAFFSEYVQTKQDGKPNSMWKKMPRLMLAKCAEAHVLRKAFPAELSGLYTNEEMGTDEIPQLSLEEMARQTEFEIKHEEKTGNPPPEEKPKKTIREAVREREEAEETNVVDGEIVEDEPKTAVQAARNEIERLLEAIDVKPEKALEKFDKLETGVKRGEALRNVRIKFIKDKIAADEWKLSEDGTTEFLAKSGVEGIDSAKDEQLADVVRRIDELEAAPF